MLISFKTSKSFFFFFFLMRTKVHSAFWWIYLVRNGHTHVIILPVPEREDNIFFLPSFSITYYRSTYQLLETHLKHTPRGPCILAPWPFLSGFSLRMNKCISLCHETRSLPANKEHRQHKCSRRCGREIGILTSMIDMRICPKVALFAEI